MVKSRRKASSSGVPKVLSRCSRRSAPVARRRRLVAESARPSGGARRRGRAPRRVQLTPEGRDLDRLRAESDVRQAETPADDPAVPEQPLDLVRMRRGADVEVLRPAAEQQIAHAATDEVGE